MKKKIIILILLLICQIVLLKCEIDHGLYPASYQIKGKVLFVKGAPPENTDRIEVFALKEFPPQDPQNFLYLGRSGTLDFTKGNQISYDIQVSQTSYQLIGLLWKEKGHDWDLTGLMGIYTGEQSSIFPDSVVVTKNNPVVENVNIYANWETVSKESHISGKITYEGQWPDDTSLLLLGVYHVKPTTEFSFLVFENVDYTQPIFVDSSTYRLAVNSSIYNYIVLFWVGNSIKNLSDLIPIGIYENSDHPGEPGTVDLTFGGEAENINISVNFNNIDFP